MKYIEGYEGLYKINEKGEVFSVHANRLLKQFDYGGYLVLSLYLPGEKGKTHFIHRLVAKNFLGKAPKNYQVRHLDGNKKNNNLSNLKYGTSSENQQDRLRHGTDNRGEKSGKAKLKKKEVIKIKKLLKLGRKKADIARLFNISRGAISEIALGRSWGWL